MVWCTSSTLMPSCGNNVARRFNSAWVLSLCSTNAALYLSNAACPCVPRSRVFFHSCTWILNCTCALRAVSMLSAITFSVAIILLFCSSPSALIVRPRMPIKSTATSSNAASRPSRCPIVRWFNFILCFPWCRHARKGRFGSIGLQNTSFMGNQGVEMVATVKWLISHAKTFMAVL